MSHKIPQTASSAQQETVAILIILTSALTIFCTAIFFVYLIKYPKLHNFEVFMVMMIIIGDFVAAIAIGLPTAILWNMDYNEEYYNSIWCMASAFFRQLGTLLEFFWSLNIALTAYYSYDGKTQRNFRIILGFLGPFLLSSIPAIAALSGFSAYGPSADIIPNSQGEPIQLNSSFYFFRNIGSQYKLWSILMFSFTFEAPIMLIMIIIICLFVRILIRIKSELSTKLQKNIYFRLLAYPFILFITQIMFMMIVIVNMFIQIEAYNFQIICYTICNMAGILDFLAYRHSLIDLQDNLEENNELQLENSLQENLN